MKKLLTVLFLLLLGVQSMAQEVNLHKRISINETNISYEQLLELIEEKAEVRFSYDANLFQSQKNMSYHTSNNTLATVLEETLGSDISWKVRGKYIILQKKTVTKKDFYVSGMIIDQETGKSIENVSIYEPLTLASTLSNTKGYYKLKLPLNQRYLDLHFVKEAYDMELRELKTRNDQTLNLAMNKTMEPKKLTEEVLSLETPTIRVDSLPKMSSQKIEMAEPKTVITNEGDRNNKINLPKIDLSEELAFIDNTSQKVKNDFMEWLMTSRQNAHAKNIQDSLYKPFQVSLLPFVGTNLKLSPFVTNDYSFNIVAGYTGSVRKLEIGGAVNVVREQMTGVQIGGAVNIVGQKTDGLQIAGSSNFNLGYANGLVIAGASNFNLKDSKGLQIAGALNATFHSHTGLQLAPFNYAGKIIGTQIGVFNFSKDASQGTPIGFFSYAKNGYRRLELNISELNSTEISFKTGVSRFYNVFNAAFNYNQTRKPVFGMGYGLGTSWSYGRVLGSNLDFVSTTYLPQRNSLDFSQNWSQQWQLNLGLEAKLTQRIAVFVAPSLNFYLSSDDTLDFSKYPLLISNKKFDRFSQSTNLYTWIGYKVGLRLCNKV